MQVNIRSISVWSIEYNLMYGKLYELLFWFCVDAQFTTTCPQTVPWLDRQENAVWNQFVTSIKKLLQLKAVEKDLHLVE